MPQRSIGSWLIWLFAIACLPPLGLNVMVPLDAALREGLQLSPFQAQAALALYVLGLAAGQPLAGIGADRWGRRGTLAWGLALALCGSMVAAMSTGAAALLLGRLVTGLGLSVALVVPRTTLRDLCGGRSLQRGMAIISLAFALMPAIGPILGWWLLTWGGSWRVALGVVPALVALVGLVAITRHKETRPAETAAPGWEVLGVIWRLRTQRCVALGFAAISSVFFLLIAQGPSALRDSTGMDGQGIAWVLGGTYLGFLAGSAWVAGRARRTSGLAQCVRGGALAGLGALVIASCVWWPTPSTWVVGMLLYATGHGMVFPAALGVVMQAVPSQAGMASALVGMLQMGAGAVVAGCAALLPGTSTERTAAVAVLMVGAGIVTLLAAGAGPAAGNDEDLQGA